MTDFESSSQTSETPAQTDALERTQFRLPLWLKIAILGAVVAMAAVGYWASQIETNKHLHEHQIVADDAEEIAQRKPVRDFILTDVSGATKKLSDFRGNVVILSFWASWCGPCLSELPTFAGIEKKFHEQGLRVVPVNVDDGDEGRKFAAEFWPRKSIPFPTFYDVTKDLANQFEVDNDSVDVRDRSPRSSRVFKCRSFRLVVGGDSRSDRVGVERAFDLIRV